MLKVPEGRGEGVAPTGPLMAAPSQAKARALRVPSPIQLPSYQILLPFPPLKRLMIATFLPTGGHLRV